MQRFTSMPKNTPLLFTYLNMNFQLKDNYEGKVFVTLLKMQKLDIQYHQSFLENVNSKMNDIFLKYTL